MQLEKIADIKIFNDTFVDMVSNGLSKDAASSARVTFVTSFVKIASRRRL
jgi:hypothetical protein